jgi:hypothetical protein
LRDLAFGLVQSIGHEEGGDDFVTARHHMPELGAFKQSGGLGKGPFQGGVRFGGETMVNWRGAAPGLGWG